MSRRRQARKEERATFGRKGSANRFPMRQKLGAIGDDFYYLLTSNVNKAFGDNAELLVAPTSPTDPWIH